jgi:hypothetical protein
MGRRRDSLSPSSPSSPGADRSLSPLCYSVSGGDYRRLGRRAAVRLCTLGLPGPKARQAPSAGAPYRCLHHPPLLTSPTAQRPPPPQKCVPNAPFSTQRSKNFRRCAAPPGGPGEGGEEGGEGEGEGRRGKEGGGKGRGAPLTSPTAAYVTHRPTPTAAYVTHRPTQISLHFSTVQTIWVGGRRGAPARPPFDGDLMGI